MSIYTTYDQYPGVLERNRVYMDVQIRNRIENTAYRIWAGQNLNDMYGDPASSSVGGDETARQMLFEVKSGKIHLSSSTKSRRLGRWISGSMRQQTRAVFNYTDYLAAPVEVTTALFATVLVGDRIVVDGPAGAAVVFTAVAGAPTRTSFEFQIGLGTDILDATDFVATFNEATTVQPAITASIGAGTTLTASNGNGTLDTVTFTAGARPSTPYLATTVAEDNGTPSTTTAGRIVLTSGDGSTGQIVNLRGRKQSLPPPETMVFFRLQQVKNGVPVVVQGATNTGDPIMGPILPVPPSTWWTMPQAMLSLSGTAPASTTAASGITPQSVMDPDQQARPVPMHIVMPRLTDSCVIRNLDTTNSMFVALGLEHHYVEIPPETTSQSFGAIKEIVLAGSGANTINFVIDASIVMGRPLT